jgi:CubicO group peptidase (beta-lactamase class C family)
MGKPVGGKTGDAGKKQPTGQRSSRTPQLSPAGAKIVSAFQEAIDVIRSGKPLSGRLTVRSYRGEFVRPTCGPEDVRRVRDLLSMSQVVFARFLGVNPNMVRSWGQGTRPPSSIARRFMGEIEDVPIIGDSASDVPLWTKPSRPAGFSTSVGCADGIGLLLNSKGSCVSMRATTGAILVCLASAASLIRAQPASPFYERLEALDTAVPNSGFELRVDAGGANAEAVADSPSTAIDEVVRSEMQKRQIPGLSLAIIQDGKIVAAKGYGVTEKGGETPVTSSTLFQAGSISKPVAALGALRLVEQGRLALDDDVNTKLRSWMVPESELTKEKKVTLRGLLSHTAGLTVHGFPGYATDEQLPTLVQILDGDKPANTRPIRVDVLPGSIWRYSGGGYTVMQQMVIDVTGKAYPVFMQETVLGPLGMADSTFEQPLPAEIAKRTATGHYLDRTFVKGRWHIYPEMAAAGLWTTPSELARFAMGVQEAAAGKAGKTLSREMARQMLTAQKNGYGLGVSAQGSGTALQFGHGGRDEGFDARLAAYAETGQGAAIMINANDNSQMISRILEAIAREYHWPDASSLTPSRRPVTKVAEDKLSAYVGRYELANNQMLTFTKDQGRLLTVVDGFADEEFLAEADDQFDSQGRNIQITFLKARNGEVDGILWKAGGRERKAPRIGPLFHSLKPRTDPDPKTTEQVFAALKALGQGGKAIADSPLLTPGARADFGNGGTQRDLAGLRSVIYLAEQDVSGRKIERHKGDVSRILHLTLVTDKGSRGLLIHMTADGLITDYDIVED